MCKYLHAGKAASGGVLAGLLAQQGFDSGNTIQGDRGFSRIYISDVSVPESAEDGVDALGNHPQRLQALCERRGVAPGDRHDAEQCAPPRSGLR